MILYFIILHYTSLYFAAQFYTSLYFLGDSRIVLHKCINVDRILSFATEVYKALKQA